MMAFALAVALVGILPNPVPSSGLGIDVAHSGGALAKETTPEIVCIQEGMLNGYKVPADTAEVANDCVEAGSAHVVRAIWCGGYTEWEPGDPHITTFHVRFYEELDCKPFSLIAEYLSAEPDTFSMGYCTDGLPCYQYELEVDVPVGPDPFWFSVQSAFAGKDRYPPKWGRLGDEADFGCGNRVRPENDIEWLPLDPIHTDVSQKFVVEHPTPAEDGTWGAIKARYW